MISLRYHAVSIAAVFLALAVGVVLGSSGVSDRVLAAVSTQRDDLGAEVTRLTAERDALAAQERAAGEFASRVGPAAVRGLLAGQTVALVVAGADNADRDGVVTRAEIEREATGYFAQLDANGDGTYSKEERDARPADDRKRDRGLTPRAPFTRAALVERALRDVLADTTALVVAHRASTVLLADRVALLQGGRITAVGRHSDLLAEVPAYRALLSSEFELAGAVDGVAAGVGR